MVLVKNLSFSYKNSNRKILDDISLDFETGRLNVIIGLNGAGKTTLFDIITGVILTNNGLYDVPKEDEIVYQFQTPVFPPTLKGKDYIRVYLKTANPKYNLNDIIESELLATREQELLKRLWTTKIGDMSAGERRWLQILSITEIQNKKLYIFDEPTTGIDPDMRKKVINRIAKITEDYNKLVIMSSHILHELEFIDSKIFLLHNGKVLFKGNYQDFLNSQNTTNPDEAFQNFINNPK